jgi:small GTP-binding protein
MPSPPTSGSTFRSNTLLKTQRIHLLLLIVLCTFLSIADAFQNFVNPRLSGFTRLESQADPEDSFNYDGRILAPDAEFRCGFVSLIGAANMGKSTLLNALLDENLCTATHRPQTTRHAILGVLTSEEQKVQLCFQDTPGVIEDPAYKLQEGMMEAVQGAFRDSDVILVITDMFSTPIPNDELFRKLNLSDKKKIVVINKIDLAEKISKEKNYKQQYYNADDEDAEILYKRTVTVEDAVQNWRGLVPDALAIIPIIASNGPDNVGVKALRTLLCGGPDVPATFRDLGKPMNGMLQSGIKFIDDELASKLIPISPPLYDPDTLTDRTER